MKTLRDMAGVYLAIASGLWGLKSLPEPGICIVCNCVKQRAGRQGAGSRPLCHAHMQQVKTVTCPEVVLFHNLKKSAKRRKIEFKLTIEQWRAFCTVTGYTKGRIGRRGELLSVDRIDPKKGYSYDNIQALTVSENISKMNREVTRRKTIRGGRVITLKHYEAKEETEESIIDRI